MLTSTDLKRIVTETRPLVEQQLDLAEQIAGLREVVTAAGGDWSQLKALVKAQIQDERDDAGDGKRVRKILDRADYATAYADMLGFAKMNEKNSFADTREERAKRRTSESMDDNKALSAELVAAGLISPEAHAENVAIADGIARKFGAGVVDPETGEIEPADTLRRPSGEDITSAQPVSASSPDTQSTAAPMSEPRKDQPTSGKGASRTVPQASHADNREAVTGPHRASGETNLGVSGGRQLQPALRTGVAPGAVDTNSNVTQLRPKKQWTYADKAHPDCLDPAQCGGFSNHGLCERCKAQLAGVIEHHGEVG